MEKNTFRQGFFAMVFTATGDTIKTEQEAGKYFQTTIIPTPREISKSCGLAIRFSEAAEEDLKNFFQQIQVPCALYFLSEKKEDGMRTATLLKQHN